MSTTHAARLSVTDQALADADILGGLAVEFPRSHQVFAEGEPGDRLYIIQSGKVKLGCTTADRREHLVGGPGPVGDVR